MLTWLRRRRLRAQPFPERWQRILDASPFYLRLDRRERAALAADARVLMAEKNWEGCGGLALEDAMRVTIAAQAARLLLNLKHDYFRRTTSILVYPSTFVIPKRAQGVVVSESVPLAGEAWHRGPVVLAWDAVEHCNAHPEEGHNTVLHEFAHELDMLDGIANGTPPLRSRQQYRTWHTVMTTHFRELAEEVAAGVPGVLDGYGSTTPAEFFAVCTESFFERPIPLREERPALYRLLAEYYGQDPARREQAAASRLN